MKKFICLTLLFSIFMCGILSLAACEPVRGSYDGPISSEKALKLAKDEFETSLERNSKYSKVFSPSYGRCDVEKSSDGKYWNVTLRGNFDYYTDDYASGKLKNETFNETLRIPTDSSEYVYYIP